jgi:hypothetical protein
LLSMFWELTKSMEKETLLSTWTTCIFFLLNDSLLLSPFTGDGRGRRARTLAGPRRLNRLATRPPMPPLVGHTNIGIVDILCSISNGI